MTIQQRLVKLRQIYHFGYSDVEIYGGISIRRQKRIELSGATPALKDLWQYGAAYNMQLWEIFHEVDKQ